MSGFSEKALRKLRMNWLPLFKSRMLRITDEEHVENLVIDVRKLTFTFIKLESGLAISKNITTVLSERLVQMER